MKKILIMLCLVFSLTACNNAANEVPNTEEPGDTGKAEGTGIYTPGTYKSFI